MTLANWRSLAVKLGVPSKTFKLFERRSTQSPTNQLFEYLGSTCPHMTVKTLEEAMKKMERNDLLAILHEKIPQGKLNSFLEDNKWQRFFTILICDAIMQRKKNVNYRNSPRESLLTLLLTFCFIRSIRSSMILWISKLLKVQSKKLLTTTDLGLGFLWWKLKILISNYSHLSPNRFWRIFSMLLNSHPTIKWRWKWFCCN